MTKILAHRNIDPLLKLFKFVDFPVKKPVEGCCSGSHKSDFGVEVETSGSYSQDPEVAGKCK